MKNKQRGRNTQDPLGDRATERALLRLAAALWDLAKAEASNDRHCLSTETSQPRKQTPPFNGVGSW
jgi:hypothetical protein